MSSRIPPRSVEIKKLDLEESRYYLTKHRIIYGALAVFDVGFMIFTSVHPIGWKRWFHNLEEYNIYTSTAEFVGISILRALAILLFLGLTYFESSHVISSIKEKSSAVSKLSYLTHFVFLTLAVEFNLYLLKIRDFRNLYVSIGSNIAVVMSLIFFIYTKSLPKIHALFAKDQFVLKTLNTVSSGDYERILFPAEEAGENPFSAPEGAELSLWGLFKVLRPFFWPQGRIGQHNVEKAPGSSTRSAEGDLNARLIPSGSEEEGDGSATGKSIWVLRFRATATWVCVITSKTCSIASPLFMGEITRRLVLKGEYTTWSIWTYIFIWVALNLAERFFKELQSVCFLPVKQEAGVELSERMFEHLVEKMGYEWHIKKKMGQVMRACDRGSEAAANIANYGFLMIIPALIEASVIGIIFLTVFDNTLLSAIVIGGVFLYCYLTIMLTNWRAKLRQQANRRDNKVHDVMTDCLINIETVKSFANESNEVKRYSTQVRSMLFFSSKTEKSLAILNSIQQLMIFATVGGALVITANSIVTGDNRGGKPMDVGDFASVLSYTTKVFAPFNVLGTIYNMLVRSFTDIKNLSQLFGMQSDVFDKPDAIDLSAPSYSNPSVPAIKFTNVVFQYGSDASSGLVMVDEAGNIRKTANAKPTHEDAATKKAVKQIMKTRRQHLQMFRHIEKASALASFASNPDATDNDLQANLLESGTAPVVGSSYKGGGLRGITFSIKEGETVGIVGHTGAGKTTLTRLLMRFVDPHAGDVSVFGQNVKDVTQTSLRGSVFGVVPQDCVLFNDSILYNLLYGHQEAQKVLTQLTSPTSRPTTSITTAAGIRSVMGGPAFVKLMKQVIAAVDAAQLMEFINKNATRDGAKETAPAAAAAAPAVCPASGAKAAAGAVCPASGAFLSNAALEYELLNSDLKKWDTLVGERGLKLSGGEKQRVSIARCLLKNPSILIFDEATSALDTQTEALVQKAIDGVTTGGIAGKKRTCVVIAHRLSTVRKADKIIVLHNGKIAEIGSHDQLMKAQPLPDKVSLLDDIDEGEYLQLRERNRASFTPANEEDITPPLGIYRRLWDMQLSNNFEQPAVVTPVAEGTDMPAAAAAAAPSAAAMAMCPHFASGAGSAPVGSFAPNPHATAETGRNFH